MTRTDILWAGQVAEEPAGTGTFGFVLGAPDALETVLINGQSATFSAWSRASYEGLADLLGTVTSGDAVTADMLERADVIAFEMNGGSPAQSGGWESCDWEFRDSRGSLLVHWQEGTVGGVFLGPPLPRDPHVVANGSITGAAYGAFFGIPVDVVTKDQPTLPPDRTVISFLLLRVRDEVDVTDPAFQVTLRGVAPGPATPEATPDPDAVGILRHGAALPAKPVKPKKSAARRVFDLCRFTGTTETIVPALAAVWQRHAAGQPSRNDFERAIYGAFDGLPQDQHDALASAFDGFQAFRARRTDTCLFKDDLAAVVPQRPLEPAEFVDHLVGEGLAVVSQRLLDHAEPIFAAGRARPWLNTPFQGPDDHVPGPGVLAPWPWITAIRPNLADFTEFGNTESFSPRGEVWTPLPYQFDQVCALQPAPGGTVTFHCDRVHPPPPPPGGLFAGQCQGGPRYQFNNDCLAIPAQSAGSSVRLRGFNFITPSVSVHLQSRDDPHAPPVVLECSVSGGSQDDSAKFPDVEDYALVPIPGEDPHHLGAPFPSGLYDIWVSVLDGVTDPTHPVERESNRLILRVEPNPSIKFTLASPGGRCVRTTSGPGDDEIWWDAFVGQITPAEALITADHSQLRLDGLDHKQFPRDPWDGVSDGDQVNTGPVIWGPASFGLNSVVCVAIIGFEVDSEDAAREQLQGFWNAFSKALLAVAGTAIGVAGAASSVIDRALKAGASIKVSMEAMAIGGAIVAGVTLISCALWAAWAPADLIALDIFTLDASTAADRTNPKKPLPAGSARSFHSALTTNETPQPKTGPAGASASTWNQQDEYVSDDEDSRYILNFTLGSAL